MNLLSRRILSCNIHNFRSVLCYPYRPYHISVEPNVCMQDAPVAIRATGLKPNENVTISAVTNSDDGDDFFSYAYFKADKFGCVDVEKSSSLGGTYKGCLPMGFMSSLQRVENDKRYYMYTKKKTEEPMKFKINLMRGFLGREKCATAGDSDIESSVTHERHILVKGTVKIPVRHGRVRGSLFLPPGKGPFPAVIDIHGSNGGLREITAAQLSSHGFATLAVAYFRYDDLPKTPTVIDLEYFQEAIHFVQKHEQVSTNGVGVVGLSVGAGISLALGCFLKEVKAVVAIAGMPAATFWPLKYKDIYIPAIEPDLSTVTPGDGMLYAKDLIAPLSDHPESILPLEKSNANMLFVLGTDDQSWHVCEETQRVVQRLREQGRSNFEIVELDGAGHMIEPPFKQFVDRIFHTMPKEYLYLGGKIHEHTLGEQIAWVKKISFLKKHLS